MLENTNDLSDYRFNSQPLTLRLINKVTGRQAALLTDVIDIYPTWYTVNGLSIMLYHVVAVFNISGHCFIDHNWYNPSIVDISRVTSVTELIRG